MAELVPAGVKRGIGLSPYGTPYPFNPEAEYYFSLGLSDELKFERNEKTQHVLIAEALGLEYRGEKPILNLSDMERDYGRDALRRAGWDGVQPVVGINTGAGLEFANKMMGAGAILEAIDAISAARRGVFIALLGGPGEREKNSHLAQASRLRAVNTGTDHPLRGFAGIIAHCDVVLTGDTLAMHIAIALERGEVACMGLTISTFYGREPFLTWLKTKFVRFLAQRS